MVIWRAAVFDKRENVAVVTTNVSVVKWQGKKNSMLFLLSLICIQLLEMFFHTLYLETLPDAFPLHLIYVCDVCVCVYLCVCMLIQSRGFLYVTWIIFLNFCITFTGTTDLCSQFLCNTWSLVVPFSNSQLIYSS